VKTGERGIIPVNEHFQKNIENIYAAGDVIGFPALTGSAISPLLPNGIYTIPDVGMVGETEESLKKGVVYIVGRANYRENARGPSATWMAFLSCSFVRTI
jgi:NAD(P) transhydrogenase